MLLTALQERVNDIKLNGLYRQRISLGRHQSQPTMIQYDGRALVNFSSNDYLSLSHHPAINQALVSGIEQFGMGGGSSVFVSGYTEAQARLEEMFAKWLGVDQAILFNTGYSANIGVISALLSRQSLVYSDKHCHASMIDGVLLSQAKLRRYQHLSSEHLRDLCERKSPHLIMTESVFSMDGDMAPISEIVSITKQYQSGLVIDDAHGIGVMGAYGRGCIEQFDLTQDDYTCIVLPLGKAFNGVGGLVAGRAKVIEGIVQLSRICRYTTALPPALCAGLVVALEIIQHDHWRREKLNSLISFFIEKAEQLHLPIKSNHNNPIMPIIIGSVDKAMMLQSYLAKRGFYVQAIRPPTVPAGTARLRISLNCMHTENMIDELLEAVATGMQVSANA